MIWELVVTSAARGLKPGRSGFQPVLQTRGIHGALAESLEKASAYTWVHPAGHPLNPQIRSHVVRQGAWGTTHVLSRIIDAGNGYDGRSNKLAHHVAFDAREVQDRARSSPAAVLMQLERSGALPAVWQGDPREQPAGPTVPNLAAEPGICAAWSRLARDAGWAGVLVDRALRREPTWIIAPPGVDLLELFAEALALVNYPQRWGITFTTYATDANDALWLGTVDGSPQAQTARGQSRIAVVDLVRGKPLTEQSQYVAAARGTATVPWKREAPLPGVGGPQPVAPGAGVPAGAAVLGGPAVPTAAGGPPALGGNRPPPVGGTRPPPIAGQGTQGDLLPPPDGFEGEGIPSHRTRRGSPWVAPLLAVTAIVLVGAVVGFVPPVRDALVALVNPPEKRPEGDKNDSGAEDAADGGSKPKPPEKKDPPLPPTDYAGRAEREAGEAQTRAAQVAALGSETNELLKKIGEGLTALEGAAKAANDAIDARQSPGAHVEAIAKQGTDLDAWFTRAGAIPAEVKDAVEAAGKAAEAAAAVAKDAEAKGAPANVVERAQQLAKAARDKADEASKNQKEFSGSDAQLAEARKRFDAAKPGAMRATERVAAAREQFKALQSRLEQAKHFPIRGLDPSDGNAQTAVLCEVGDALIDIDLPSEGIDKAVTVCHLKCVPVPDKPGTWNVMLQKQGLEQIGTARVTEEKKLEVTVVSGNDMTPGPGEHRPQARAALLCSALRIRNALDGGGTPPPESTTYVQLASPVLAGPLVLPKFFQGGTNDTDYPRPGLKSPEYSGGLPGALPPSWPVTVAFEGACGGLHGRQPPDGAVTLHEIKTEKGTPLGLGPTWSMQWGFKDQDKEKHQPIVTTDFEMGRASLERGPYIKVSDGRLGDGWNTRDTLVRLNANNAANGLTFGGFFSAKTLEAQTIKVSPATLDPVLVEVVMDLVEGRKDKGDWNKFKKMDNTLPARSLDEWREHFRTVMKDLPGYKAWVARAHPHPGGAPGKDEPEAKKQHHQQQLQKHNAAAAAEERYLDEYWADLRGRLKKDQEQCKEIPDAAVCRLRERLVEIKEGKARVADLLTRARGYPLEGNEKKGEFPEARITGEIAFVFPSLPGCKAVFMSFQEGQGSGAPGAQGQSTDVPDAKAKAEAPAPAPAGDGETKESSEVGDK